MNDQNNAQSHGRLEAILFDLDGVLADSEVVWDSIDAEFLATYGITYGGEHKRHVLGKSYPLALQFYKDTYQLPHSIEDLLARRRHVAADYYANHIGIFKAVPEVLEALRGMGLRLGLATSSVGMLVQPFLERHGLTRQLDGIVTGEEVERGKPFPDIYLLAARKVGVAPEHCLVIEDALAGIEAGQAAGMRVVAIPDPRVADVSTYAGKGDYLLDNLGELPTLVRTLLQPQPVATASA